MTVPSAEELAYEWETPTPPKTRSVAFGPKAASKAWGRDQGALPPEVRQLAGRIEVLSLRCQAVERIEEELLPKRLDAAARKAAWRSAMGPSRRDASLGVVRRVVDDIKFLGQLNKIVRHETATELPPWQKTPSVVDGVLAVRDVPRRVPTFGLRSYPEATPIEVVVFVVEMWMRLTRRTRPSVWDPTSGGGTVHDVIRTVYGGRVASTDAAIDNQITTYGKLSDIGRHFLHRKYVSKWNDYKIPTDRTISRPDLVFIHPPSRGWPGCTWVYKTRTNEEMVDWVGTDLTYDYEQDGYEQKVAAAVETALSRLRSGGLVSLLLPEYFRWEALIHIERGIADGILTRLKCVAELVDRHEVVDLSPVRQASANIARGPLVHLILRPRRSP